MKSFKRTQTIFIILVTLLSLPFISFATADEIALYVSPQGNDSWIGTSADKPFATIQQAQQAIRELKQKGQMIKPVTVYLRSGRYELSAPLIFKSEDSGTESYPITYTAYSGEKPVISGGKIISGWKLGEKGLWTAEVPGVKEGVWKFRQLYVNGESRRRSWLPKEGFYRIAGLPDGGIEVKYNTPARRFEFAPGDIKSSWTNPEDIEVVVLHFWVDTHLPVATIDEEKNMVTFSRTSRRRFTDDHLPKGARYYVDNVFEGLENEGEWYLNSKTGVLYYKPRKGEDMKNVEVIAPLIPHLVRFEGEPGKLQFVENITFRGLTFMHTNWDLPKDDAGDYQAAFGVPGALYGFGARNCSVENCTIKNLGNYAVELSNGCWDNRFFNNEISDIAAGGFKITGGDAKSAPVLRTGRTVISDNHVHHLGEIFPSAIGVLIGHSEGNIVAHNEIDHLYYTGISIGWVWGYARSVSRDNKIEYNHIHDVGQGMLSDMGGIYMLGIAPGTVVRNNLLHDISSHGYGGWGIYTDEGSSHVLIENNVVYQTKTGGFHQHYGRENVVRNNIFAFAAEGQIIRSRMEEHVSFFFENNIVYWDKGPLLGSNWKDDKFILDYNLYYNPNPDSVKFKDWTFEEWKNRGYDVHSLIADPLFVDPYNGNFTIKPESPAFKLGFRQIDMSTVGPRKQIQR